MAISSKLPSLAPSLYHAKRSLSVSPTLALGKRTKELIEEGKTVYRFGLGESPFPVPQIMVEELKKNAFQKSYGDVSGLRELREVVATYLSGRSGEEYSAESIAIAPGSKMLMYLLQLALDGCNLILPSPSWVSYAPQANLCGSTIQFLATSVDSDWKIDLNELEDACKAFQGDNTILYLNYPSNPGGTTYDRDELEQIAHVARQYGVMILADEIYFEFTHSLENPASIAEFYPEGTILSTAVSKCWGAGGWRLGAFAFPNDLADLRRDIVALGSETYSSPAAPIQHASIKAFEYGPEVQQSVEQAREVLKRVGKFSHHCLTEAGISVAEPTGGFYLLLDFSPFQKKLKKKGLGTSEAFASWALDNLQVATIPGTGFYLAPEHIAVRVAFLDFDGTKALQAIQEGSAEAGFVETHCPKIHEGMHRIADWCSKL